MIPFEIARYSNKGRRKKNEDSLLVHKFNENPAGLRAMLAVADGIGGEQGGEVASNLAVTKLRELIIKNLISKEYARSIFSKILTQVYTDINDIVFSEGTKSYQLNGMGTTLTSFFLFDDEYIITNLGDSRAYLINEDEVFQLTEDHTVLGEAIKNGSLNFEEAASYSYGNALTRSIGNEEDPIVDIFPFSRAIEGDVVLLCSDGFYKFVNNKTIIDQINLSGSLLQALENLASIAFTAESDDNISLLAIRFGKKTKNVNKAKHHSIESLVGDKKTSYQVFNPANKINSQNQRKGLKILSSTLFILFLSVVIMIYLKFPESQKKFPNKFLATKNSINREDHKNRELDQSKLSSPKMGEEYKKVELDRSTFWKMSITDSIKISKFHDKSLSALCEENGIPYPQIPDISILIQKNNFTLSLLSGKTMIKKYPISLGKNYDQGKKELKGDYKTPEGDYQILLLEGNGLQSLQEVNDIKIFREIYIDYPNVEDIENAAIKKIITPEEKKLLYEDRIAKRISRTTRLGSRIGIHDGGNLSSNWTRGGIALGKEDLLELFQVLKFGSKVKIVSK